MAWPWRKTREPAPPPTTERGSRYSTAALETFLEQARAAAAWHEARASAIERKAGVLLGFVGRDPGSYAHLARTYRQCTRPSHADGSRWPSHHSSSPARPSYRRNLWMSPWHEN